MPTSHSWCKLTCLPIVPLVSRCSSVFQICWWLYFCRLNIHLIRTATSIGSPLAAQLLGNVSAIYSPELHVGFTPVGRISMLFVVTSPPHHALTRRAAVTIRYDTPHFSNHNSQLPQSFHEQGFPATQVFERIGPSMFYPPFTSNYHMFFSRSHGPDVPQQWYVFLLDVLVSNWTSCRGFKRPSRI